MLAINNILIGDIIFLNAQVNADKSDEKVSIFSILPSEVRSLEHRCVNQEKKIQITF
jgi:hypothetical protein